MAPNFLLKSRLAAEDFFEVGGLLVVEQYARLREQIIEKLGRDFATFFAEPVLGRREATIEIAWYAEVAGEPVAFTALDAASREAVAERCKARLAALASLLNDPEVAPLLRPALYIYGEDSLLVVGREPVIVNWAALPGRRNLSAEERRTRFAGALGRYAPFPAPDLAPPQRAGAASSAASPSLTATPQARRAFTGIGVYVATGVCAVIALLLSLPGILQSLPSQAHLTQGDLDEMRKVSKAMRDKNEETRRALDSADCGPNGDLKPPGGNKLPPAPDPLKGAEAPITGGMRLVAQRANDSVVMVLTCGNKANWEVEEREEGEDASKAEPNPCPKSILTGQNISEPMFFTGLGSGFFIGPQTVVTNQHVIAHADVVAIINHFFGGVRPAKIVAATTKLNIDDPDFAVLHADVEKSPDPIPLATKTRRLQDVVSAGFPGLFLEEEPAFIRLLRGDEQSVPDPITFPGYVTLTVGDEGAQPRIYSSANIGHGNSGGPLLDLCGRAVGVNTWERAGKDEEAGFKVNIAEGAKGLRGFLEAHGVPSSVSDDACDAEANAQNAPQPKPVPTAPSPTATP